MSMLTGEGSLSSCDALNGDDFPRRCILDLVGQGGDRPFHDVDSSLSSSASPDKNSSSEHENQSNNNQYPHTVSSRFPQCVAQTGILFTPVHHNALFEYRDQRID